MTEGLKTAYSLGLCLVLVLFYDLTAKAESNPCEDLARARGFSFAAEVAAGTVLTGERAFAQVLHRSDRLICLEKIVATGTNEARMYALAALRELSPGLYQAALAQLRRRWFTVTTLATEQQGILRSEMSASVISKIDRGTYQNMVRFWLKHKLPPDSEADEIYHQQLEKLRARLRKSR
jgi:hypothetical protein